MARHVDGPSPYVLNESAYNGRSDQIFQTHVEPLVVAAVFHVRIDSIPNHKSSEYNSRRVVALLCSKLLMKSVIVLDKQIIQLGTQSKC